MRRHRPSSTRPSTALLLWWGHQGYTRARDFGYDQADAEDIRQDMILELLTRGTGILNLRFSLLHACATVTRQPSTIQHWRAPLQAGVDAWDARLDVHRLWGQLGKGEQACLRHWLEMEEDPDIPTPSEKRRWHHRLRVLAKLRDAIIMPEEV